MARKIDFSQPLSEADQAYVRDRPWLLQDARLRGEDIISDDEFQVEDSEEGDSDETLSDETLSDDEDESEDSEEDSEEDEVAPYEEWDYQELKDEAKRRELSAGGSKEQLVKRLQDSDSSSE